MTIFRPFSGIDLSQGRDVQEWRTRILDGILHGIFFIWLFVLATGVNNVVEAYRQEIATTPNAKAIALAVAAFYVGVTLLLSFITFVRKLPFNIRAGALLFLFYLVGTIGLALSSLSGDGRIFLFALVILTAVLFDLRASLIVLGGSLLTLVVIGWLEVTNVIVVPAERQINSSDLGAWISGTVVFVCFSVAGLISITYLLRALGRSLQESREGLEREQRLTQVLRTIGNINQLIVRERDSARLLLQACEHLVAGRGYAFVWIGLLEADGVTLKLAASAGETVVPDQFTTRLDREGVGPTCAADALHSRGTVRVPENDPCLACPLLPSYPGRSSVALPLVREDHNIGVLVVDHTAPSAFFDLEEITLLEELAGNLTYALDTLRAEEQQRALADGSGSLLFARDEDMLWMEVISAVQKILRADRVAIYHYDPETDLLSCPHYYGLSAEYVDEINRRFHSVPGSAVLTDPSTVIIENVESDPAVAALRESMLREGFRSYAIFPFYTSKGMSGAFAAYRNVPGPFSQSDLIAGGTLVRMIGLALENMGLNAEARRKASELGALYAAVQDMASSMLDTDALLLALAHHITEALQATSAYISSVNLMAVSQRISTEYWSDSAAPAERKSDLGRVFSLDDYPAFHSALTTGKVVILHDDNPHTSEPERRQFAEYNVRSMMFVPVMAHGKILGGLEIWESRQRREFTQAEISLARSMAGHAASIIETSQLFEELERREAHFRALFENSAEGVAVLDAGGIFTYITQTEEKLLGYNPFEVIGQYVFANLHPDDLSQAQAAFAECVREAGKLVMLEYRARHASGFYRTLEVVFKNLLDDPNVKGVVVNFRDITERKQAEAKIRKHAGELALAYDNTLAGWARALELRDEMTEGHTRRVTDLTLRLARAMGLGEEQIVHIRRGAILHDVGKMGIPDSVLLKRGNLDRIEREVMNRHPQYAYDMLLPIAFLHPALDIPLCHHEHWDGSGYPRGLKGTDIPLAARIFAVADVWDAVTSERPYRHAWSKEKAHQYIVEQSGKYFDPEIVKIFLSLNV